MRAPWKDLGTDEAFWQPRVGKVVARFEGEGGAALARMALMGSQSSFPVEARLEVLGTPS